MTSELQERYRDSLRARIDVLEDALPRLDDDPEARDTVRRLAHALRGSGATYGFPEISARAAAAEEAARGVLGPRVRELVEAMEAVVAGSDDVPEREGVVLAVEDDTDMRRLLSTVLDAEGRTVLVAEDGAQAEARLAAHDVDLVVLDLILPDTDGRNLLLKLREEPDTAHLPVIVTSTRTSERIKAECFALGCNAYFEKPFDPDALVAAVERELERATEAEREARRDPLTGLLNRAGLRDAFESADELGSPALVLVEVDGYAGLVNEHGTATGERVLGGVADALDDVVGESQARAGRWEGSQFVVLVPGGGDEADELAEEVVEAVRAVDVEDPAGEAFRVTVSVGVGREWLGDDTGPAPEAGGLHPLLSAARIVLNRAREAGGNRVGASEPGEEEVRKVLVAEDDDMTATLLRHRLSREGYEVLRYANGADAYEAALDIHPELVILDVKMPGMDGFELLQRLRKIPAYQEVPIMMLTSMGNESDLVRGFELGADDYVLKPFSPTELMARVQRHVRAT